MSLAKNNDNNSIKKVLYGLLEKIIFNEKDFNILKKAINDISSGNIEPKELREKIIHSRIRILEELIEIFPFYLDQISNKYSLNSFINEDKGTNNSNLIDEKDKFLMQTAKRLNIIYQKLKSKMMG